MGFVLADGRRDRRRQGLARRTRRAGVPARSVRRRLPLFHDRARPGADPFHYDHIHIDLARHDPRGERHICKPILKFTPRLDPEPSRRSCERDASGELPPIDMEQDGAEDGTGRPAERLRAAATAQALAPPRSLARPRCRAAPAALPPGAAVLPPQPALDRRRRADVRAGRRLLAPIRRRARRPPSRRPQT